jgi:hypothetical protein
MEKYVISQFDENTFVVIDLEQQREICVCSNYESWEDAEERAKGIASLLNKEKREQEN